MTPGEPQQTSPQTGEFPRRIARAAGEAAAALPYAQAPAAVGEMRAGTAIRVSLTVPGQPEQVSVARAFIDNALGAAHQCAPAAVLLGSELVTNSLLHSDSRLPGQTITITVSGVPELARVEVRDAGGPSVPLAADADDGLAEHGRGLRLVADLSARWGHFLNKKQLVTWFEVEAEPPS